ncbi:MAG TPA: hypothetical protein PKZ52_10105 [Cellvibrionaceae bacterium]|nr:hypothetical protein [Cellvibrionaceae bacterium]
MRTDAVYDPLFAAISPGAWVLTPNRRLARVLINAYNRYQQSIGRLAWQAPNILAWADGLELLWQRAFASLGPKQCPQLGYRFLSDDEALTLWQNLLSSQAQGWDLLKPESLAGPAFSAWQSLQLWPVWMRAWRKPLYLRPQLGNLNWNWSGEGPCAVPRWHPYWLSS